MDFPDLLVNRIKEQFQKEGNPAGIPLLKGRKTFQAQLRQDGICVDNLGDQPFLPWAVFTETVVLLRRKGGRALRGDAMNSRLGSPDLPIDSVEGHIAHVVYGKQPGDTVFRRVTPIACILIWAGICRHEPKQLELSSSFLYDTFQPKDG